MDASKLERLQKSVRIGGKGTPRRKVKRTVKNEGDDRQLQSALQKVNVRDVPGVEAVQMFKDDGKVITFSPARVHASVVSNTYAVYGKGVERDVNELLPEMLQQLGPDSLAQLRQLSEQMKSVQGGAGANEGGDDEIPDLVAGESFDDAKEVD
jgi:nascent polypeptide-associated complex subunit beta